MITTLIRSIFLLLLVNLHIFAKEVDVTFEVFHAQNNYLDVARDKAYKLNEDSFKCYILKGKRELSVRCNDAKSTTAMQRTINRLNKRGVEFAIINHDTKTTTQAYKSLNEFYLGYAAFDRGEYKKARDIFEYNYKKENTKEHAYAYALALMKTGRNESALKVLQAYRGDTKVNKLYTDISTTYMYKELNKKNYLGAHTVVDKYKNRSKKLHTLINKQEVNDALALKEYDKASRLAKKYNLASKTFDIEYMKALSLGKKKEYEKANIVLAPYVKQEKKANDLYLSNVMALASLFYTKKDYKAALDRLAPYKTSSQKVRKLYDDILYTRALDNGWTFVDKTPKEALTSFKEACRIKKEYGCYSGMMYSYFNLEKYDKSYYLAEKLYETEPSDELSTMATRSQLKMKNYEKAKSWFDKTKNKKGLTSPYLLETFLSIDDHIKLHEYEEAQNIIEYLRNLYPQNIDILKREMQLYVLKKEYDNAQNVAEEILLLDKNSVNAKYTLALYEFEHQDYQGCAERLDVLALQKSYQKDMKYRCDAYTYASNKDMNSSLNAIRKVQSSDIKAAYYFDVGDMYKSLDDERAISFYKEASEYKKDDIDMQLVYLYALKDFKKYEELDESLALAYKNYADETKKLDVFRKAYEKERLYSYYEAKEYTKCSKYATKIEVAQKDRDVYRMSGWCAYGEKKYIEAKEKFAMINHTFGETNKDIYAYALSTYQNNENKRAVDALDRITLIEDEEEAFLVADLYINLQEQDKARELLLKLDETDKRDAMLSQLNRSYTHRIYENSASVGMYYQSQTGLQGKSKFDKFVIPLDYDYYNKEDAYHLYFDGDLMYLYNGYLQGQGNSIKDFGLGTTTQDKPLASDIGFMPKVGIDWSYLSAKIGTTPLGAKITPELTWMLAGYLPYNKWRFGLKLEQKEIDETMLSFVGKRAIDGSQEVNWGRVVKRGLEAGVSYDAGVDLSLSLGYYPQIFGLNVENNSEKKATATAIYHPKVESIAYVDVGLIVAFDAYEKNSNFFTYGHGGYFSPQQFFLGSLFTKFGDIINKDWYYQAKLGLGFEGFIVDAAQKFPLGDGIVNSGEIQTGYRDGGVVYKGAIQLGYKVNESLDLVSGISLERINGYSVQQVSFALVYRFDKMKEPTLNTFGLNHRIDQIIK